MADTLKILVFSDSHTDAETMVSIAKDEAPDTVLHLGDHIEDALLLKDRLAGVPLYMVRGNTDAVFQTVQCKDEELLQLNGKRILMCHGHRYNVKNGLTDIFQRGKAAGIDIALFGHTHEPLVCYCGSFWLMNPGRIGKKQNKAVHTSYGVLWIARAIRCCITEVF